jgi:hypothetical protein
VNIPPRLSRQFTNRSYALLYVALLIRFVLAIGRYHDPHTGFSSLIVFGDQFAPGRLPQLQDVPLYTYARSAGYDGQFYAQLAVAGNPFDPGLTRALDSPSYRARRILLPVLTHVVGLGDPARVIQAYALANLLCFMILAALLARWWFPPSDLHNLIRWGGTLFGAGMIVSVTRGLTDGPALLVIAVGVRLLEERRSIIGAAVLAAAGLIRETSVLCVGAFASPEQKGREWARASLAALCCAGPALLWAVVVSHHYGGGAGSRNFDPPFVSFARKLNEVYRVWRRSGFDVYARTELCALIGLATQVGVLLVRPRRDLIWWRIGAAFSVLWVFLGWTVWQGSPSAATRALLPLTLAFNVLAPRTRRGLALLIVGNLSVFSAVDMVQPTPTEQTLFEYGVTCRYLAGWNDPERLGHRTWRWASGSAALLFHNPTGKILDATLTFEVESVIPRTLAMHTTDPLTADRAIPLAAQKRIPEQLGPFALPPGDTTIGFTTSEPAWVGSSPDGRPLTFSIHDLFVTLSPRAMGLPAR